MKKPYQIEAQRALKHSGEWAMSEPPLDTLDFLLQADITSSRLPIIGKGRWQDLYRSVDGDCHSLTTRSGLLENGAAARAMEQDIWDLRIHVAPNRRTVSGLPRKL